MSPEPQYQQLQDRINYQFRDINNLIEALTHPSYSAESQQVKSDNQRLEFLGDAVLEIIVTTKIFFLFSDYPEGELTKIRATLAKESTLAQFAREISLGSCLRMGHGEHINKGYDRDSILSDAFEALIGAIFIDSGNQLNAADDFVNSLIDHFYKKPDMMHIVKTENPKGLLQEWAQKNLKVAPEYKTHDEVGPDHQKIFTVGVYIKQECLGVGSAKKRQSAEEMAARTALQKVKTDIKNH